MEPGRPSWPPIDSLAIIRRCFLTLWPIRGEVLPMWFSRLWIPSCFYLLTCLACTPAPQDSATLILTGDRLWTGNPEQPWAEAVAVREDRPLAVGSREELSRYQGAYTTNNA